MCVAIVCVLYCVAARVLFTAVIAHYRRPPCMLYLVYLGALQVKLEATDGPRNIIGIILPDRSVDRVCDALRGYEVRLCV